MESVSMIGEAVLSADIMSIILSHDLADSEAEAECLATSILDEMGDSANEPSVACVELFQELFSVTAIEAEDMLQTLFPELKQEPCKEKPENGSDTEEWLQEDDDDGEVIGEGECELCERDIKLTKHHLIPRSTWRRMFPRLVNAADALTSSRGSHRSQLILGEGLMHLEKSLYGADKAIIRSILQRTCLICRCCHSTIHRTHDNLTLAKEYNTVELLLRDESIYNFCKWASKQKAGKHALKR